MKRLKRLLEIKNEEIRKPSGDAGRVACGPLGPHRRRARRGSDKGSSFEEREVGIGVEYE